MKNYIAYSRATTDRQAVARHIGERGQKIAALSEIESRGGVPFTPP